MALRRLSRLTVRTNDDQEHHFYLDLQALTPQESEFINDLFPEIQRKGAGSLEYVSESRPQYEFVVPGYYSSSDLEQFKAALKKSLSE